MESNRTLDTRRALQSGLSDSDKVPQRSAHRALSLLTFFVFLLFLGPTVFQRHSAIEDRFAGLRLFVHAEIAGAFKLETIADVGVC